MRIREMTSRGVEAFRTWLDGKASGDIPDELLQNDDFSKSFHPVLEIEQRKFNCRFELGRYVNDILAHVHLSDVPRNHGIWSWLSLYFFDSLCPKSAGGTRQPRESVRYIWDVSFSKYYRHLIGHTVYSIRLYGEEAKPLFVAPSDRIVHTDYCEQIFGYQDLCQTVSFISTANRLYYDARKNQLKSGATPNTKKPGTVRRLGDVFNQIALTYDVQGMTPDQILEKLPKEFSCWIR